MHIFIKRETSGYEAAFSPVLNKISTSQTVLTMLKFLLLVNKQGHTRVSQYYEYLELKERTTMEAEITRKCLTRNDGQVSCMDM